MRAGPATVGPAIAGLVLAAGESSRMGRDKALLPYRDSTFLETVVAKLREAGLFRVVVVLGHHADKIQHAANLQGVEVVTSCDYLRGQTSSLQAGLAALDIRARFLAPLGMIQSPQVVQQTAQDAPKPPDAILLCLVDHPAFEPVTVSTLVALFARTAAPVIIPTHGGSRGHPVLIARPLFEPLLALRADQGANSVIRAWNSQTRFVEVVDAGILVDVDDPEAYRALVETEAI